MDKYIKRKNINIICQILFFVVLIVIDQLTKIIATNNLKGSDPVSVIKDIVEFKYLENSGAAFGSLQNAFWLFYILTIVVFIVLLLIWLTINKRLKAYAGLIDNSPEDFKEKTFKDIEYLGYLLAALAAGAIGNLIDRINTHYVVDFIYFKFIDFPIFNFADICVTVSVVLLCIFLLFTYKDDKNFKLFNKKDKEKKKNEWVRYTVESNGPTSDDVLNPNNVSCESDEDLNVNQEVYADNNKTEDNN